MLPETPLFHGTYREFKPGDTVLPRNTTGQDTNYGSDPYTPWDPDPDYNSGNYAYATKRQSDAHGYAEDVAAKRFKKDQAVLPHVYRVEPLGDVEIDPYGDESRNPSSVRSKDGFKVVEKVVHSGVCRSCGTLRDTGGNCGCPSFTDVMRKHTAEMADLERKRGGSGA